MVCPNVHHEVTYPAMNYGASAGLRSSSGMSADGCGACGDGFGTFYFSVMSGNPILLRKYEKR